MTVPARFRVADQLSRYPATRPLGQEGRARLDDLLHERRDLDLIIDFTDVQVMNISFTDEFLGKFLGSHDFSTLGTTVKVAGLNPDNRYSVQVCVERREIPSVIVDESGELSLIGDSLLAQTFEIAHELGQFKACDIAQRLSLSASNANNRLKRLAQAGALRKKQVTGSSRGGKEFIYEVGLTVAPDES
ncbi:DUF4325 domain-containing protein (plasmid) [Janibacter melonis]|uniref:DUF4325 domain-containing protein n=1 Tax=Janibacter melonis TaxID=262209 RepID=A0A650GFX8_9MICO|nr:DUF4325 domain-containing protein [Janibacter melonis]QGX08832.1 DUF4325 domain-containing protein [Janibacter melonis]